MYLVKTSISESSIDGEGVFAGENIPRGTIIYFLNGNDRLIHSNEISSLPEVERNRIVKYGVQEESGNWLLGEGEEKLNHSCDANVLMLFVDDIYCDIAVRDIYEGEEITADYSLFFSAFPYKMECNCRSSICRKMITCGVQIDIQTQNRWCMRISEATECIFDVKQKLFTLESEEAKRLTIAIKSKLRPKVFPYIKFSLISQE